MRSKNYAATLFAFIAILTIFTFSLSASTLSTDDPNAANNPSATNGTISFDITDTPTAVDSRLLGTNSPAWINPTKFGNSTFRARAIATGMTLNRFPGGSWSNAYDWLACERNGQGIDDDAVCWWTWAGRPTDFIDFAQSTGGEVMYTINQSGTSKEAAALVAFFNGSVNDHTTIGVDVRGRDWGKVSDWAQLRSDNGNPDPLYVKYWEIGNETYGGNSGTDCFSWGWENDVWTCDGTEYVNGIGSGVNEKEGFIKFRNEMRTVDSSIMVGAVGVTPQSGWTNWGNEVIAAAGDAMDFYIIHQYAFWSQPTNYQEALAQPQSAWQPIMIDVEAAFDQYADGRRVPIAITEHNLFSFQDNDNSQWMKRAVNMLFMADSIGQMMEHGFAMANQWNLANGLAWNGTDYGLMNVDTFARNPQYYAFPLWADFGTQMLPVASSYDAATTLSVYAGKIDEDTAVLFAINKTGNNQTADIQIDGIGQISDGTASVAQASSLDSQSVTFNGVSDPANDLSDAPPTPISGGGNPLAYTFAPYSITLLRLNLSLGSQLSVDDVSVEEGDSGTTNAVFTVSLNPDSSDTVTVNYATNDGTATAGSDYTAVSDTLTFNPGQTTKTVSVPVNGDTDPEVDETFTLDLSGALNANISDSQGVATISNDDPPLLTISDVSVDEGDSGSTNAVFTISLSPSSSQTVTVDYETNDDTATAGSDYTAVSDTLTFNPGQTTKTVSVPVNGDNVEEADETFTLDLSAAVNADISDSQGVATILDDDAPTLTISDETIAEGDSGTTNIVFTVTLSPAGIQTVMVDYATTDGTATAGSDYTAVSDTLTFPQGQTTRTITVPIHDDTVFEGIETFTIQLSNANNAIISDSVGLGSIIDLEDASEWFYLPIILKD